MKPAFFYEHLAWLGGNTWPLSIFSPIFFTTVPEVCLTTPTHMNSLYIAKLGSAHLSSVIKGSPILKNASALALVMTRISPIRALIEPFLNFFFFLVGRFVFVDTAANARNNCIRQAFTSIIVSVLKIKARRSQGEIGRWGGRIRRLY